MRPGTRSWRRRISPRAVLLAGAVAVAAVGGAMTLVPGDARTVAPSLAQRLGPRTWALAVPITWLAAPIPGLREDDIVDLLGTRSGERATASEVATGLRVMAIDDRVVVIELRSDDASAIAAARARGLSLIPIVRSVR